MKETKFINASASTSITSIISGVTSHLVELIKSKFPKDFFKDVYISDSISELLSQEQDKVAKLSKPTLIVKPEYTTENGYMEIIPQWNLQHGLFYKDFKRNYNTIIYDTEKHIYLYSVPTRVKINFNLQIKLPSVMYAYNVMHLLKQSFEVGGYLFYNNVPLETDIPKAYVDAIARNIGLDTRDVDDSEKLSEYLINNSNLGLFDKIVLASGNKAFQYRYNTNILTNVPDEPTFETNYNQQVVDNTVVNFSIVYDFAMYSSYLLELKADKFDDNWEDYNSDPFEDSSIKYEMFVPTTFIKNKLSENRHLIVNKKFSPDVNVDIDELEFKGIFKSEYKEVVDLFLTKNIDVSKYFEARILINHRELDTELYMVDWKKLILKTKKPLTNVSYTLLIYFDRGVYNKVRELITTDSLDKLDSLEL